MIPLGIVSFDGFFFARALRLGLFGYSSDLAGYKTYALNQTYKISI